MTAAARPHARPAPAAGRAAPLRSAAASLRIDGWRGYAIGFAAWMALVPFFAVQTVIGSAEAGRPLSWGYALAAVTDHFLICVPFLPLLGWVVRRAPFRAPHWVRNGVILLAAVFAVAFVRNWLVAPHVLPILSTKTPHYSVSMVFGDALVYLSVVATLHGKLYYLRFREQEVEAARLAQRLAETQLLALRAQLQPHFLFNTLNAISALMREEPDVADRMLTRLAELLRVVLEPPAGDEHSLVEELAVLDRYLEIMSLRFGSRLEVEVSVPPALHAGRVPWLVLQPLVENAIEHGAGRRRGGVRVRVRAERPAEGRLTLLVCDDGPGPAAGGGKADGRRGTGIGLENTRRRLAQLYGEGASLYLDSLPEGGACARIEMPWRPADPARALTLTGEHAVDAARQLAGAAP